jgi:CheY-like chemotaxis protein
VAIVVPKAVVVGLRSEAAPPETPAAEPGADDGMSLTPEELAAIREATRESMTAGKTLLVVPLSRDRAGWTALLAETEFDYDFAPDVIGLTRALRSGAYASVVVDADACPSGGLPALTLIREASGGTVPAVVVASSPTRTHLLSCVAAGAKGYLAKPVAPALLLDTLGAL